MKSDILISTDKLLLDIDLIHQTLAEKSYWALGRSKEIVLTSIKNSLCFGVYIEGNQVGFARVVTDEAIFAWLMDVFILEEYRGRGLGKLLMDKVLNYPNLKAVKKWGLNTKDAHKLYNKYGFREIENPSFYMERVSKK